MDRRTFLRGVPLAAVPLAGCAGGDDDGGDGSDGDGGDGETATSAASSPGNAATETVESTVTTGAATVPPDDNGASDTATTETTTVDMDAKGSVTVLVGPRGNLRFDPEFFVLREGGTVTWEWESSGHNIRVSEKPEGVNWAGSPQPPRRTFDAGFTYEWSFEQAGEYAYYCRPHQDFGMTGAFRVEQFP